MPGALTYISLSSIHVHMLRAGPVTGTQKVGEKKGIWEGMRVLDLDWVGVPALLSRCGLERGI